jgi:hypothetical protein
MPDKELKQRARWDLYLLILRAVAMFFMAAHGLYFIRAAARRFPEISLWLLLARF